MQPIPAPLATEGLRSRLDSVFLQLILDDDERFAQISNLTLIKALKAELKRFRVLVKGPADQCPTEKVRDALLFIITEDDDVDLALESPDHKVVCRMWIRELKKEINDLRMSNRVDRGHGQTQQKKEEQAHEKSVVENFFSSLQKDDFPHPRGTQRGARPSASLGHESPPPLVSNSESDTSSDEFSTDESSGETLDEKPAGKNQFAGMVPLTMDSEARANLELLKECKEPEDIRERTATWVAKTMGLHLPSIMDMLQGKTEGKTH